MAGKDFLGNNWVRRSSIEYGNCRCSETWDFGAQAGFTARQNPHPTSIMDDGSGGWAVSFFLVLDNRCSKTMENDEPMSDTESHAAAYAGGHEFDGFLGKAFEEKPIWVGLYESIRDVFFPPKLPPLQLTSKPIPVPDRMAVKANPWAIGISTTINGLILLLILFLGVRQVIKAVAPMALT